MLQKFPRGETARVRCSCGGYVANCWTSERRQAHQNATCLPHLRQRHGIGRRLLVQSLPAVRWDGDFSTWGLKKHRQSLGL